MPKKNGRPKINELEFLPAIKAFAPCEAEAKGQGQIMAMLRSRFQLKETTASRVVLDLISAGHLQCLGPWGYLMPKRIFAAPVAAFEEAW